MPGSKTFTSTKNLEFLESTLMEEYQDLQKGSRVKSAFHGVVEVAKILASTIFSVVCTKNANLKQIFSQKEPELLVKDILALGVYICVIFFVGYLFFSLIAFVLSFLFDALFNSSRWKWNRKKAKNSFYSVTVNLIMLAISFEQKSYSYHIREKAISDKTEKEGWIDLEIEYFLQAITYFQFAADRLRDTIPEKMNLRCKEKINTEYLNYIGCDNIMSHIRIALKAMNRLQKFYLAIKESDKDYIDVRQRIDEYICKDYNPILNQGDKIFELIADYENQLNLVICRKA